MPSADPKRTACAIERDVHGGGRQTEFVGHEGHSDVAGVLGLERGRFAELVNGECIRIPPVEVIVALPTVNLAAPHVL